MQAYRGLPCSMHRHAFSYILTCKTVEMQLTTLAGAGIQLATGLGID